jgi:hypothetical protein
VVLKSWTTALDTHGRRLDIIDPILNNMNAIDEQVVDPEAKTMTYYDSFIPASCHYFRSTLMRYIYYATVAGTSGIYQCSHDKLTFNFRNFFNAEAKKAGHKDSFIWDEWSFIIKQVYYRHVLQS